MNIGRIANLPAGGERVAQTAQSTYCSCHDMIRTQRLNCCKSQAEVGGTENGNAARFQVGQKPAGLYPVQVTTQRKLPWLGSLAVPTWTAAG